MYGMNPGSRPGWPMNWLGGNGWVLVGHAEGASVMPNWFTYPSPDMFQSGMGALHIPGVRGVAVGSGGSSWGHDRPTSSSDKWMVLWDGGRGRNLTWAFSYGL